VVYFSRYRRPHIVVEPESDRIVAVNWAPAFEGPLDVDDERVIDDYYKAYCTFARLLDRSPTRVEQRLEPGDLVCFNNRRMLHARHAFQSNGGSRHLQGCYVNIDEFKSRLRVLTAAAAAAVGGESSSVAAVRHVFNQCWS
jgi:alpha-ketoglutarate-dependent taurine dioxygenase